MFLALAVIGRTSEHETTVRGAYLVMAPAAWFVLVPLAHASLLSGIALSLGTTWGLFRHYWVVLKLLMTAFATAILLIYMGTFRQMAGVAADPVVELGLVRNPSPLIHSTLALILLLVTTVLGVYKPFGMTAHGRRRQHEQRRQTASTSVIPAAASDAPAVNGRARTMYFVALLLLALLLVAALLLHLAGADVRH